MLELGDYVRRRGPIQSYNERIGRIHGIDDDGDPYIIWQNVNEAGDYWANNHFERCPIFDIVYLKLYRIFNKNA